MDKRRKLAITGLIAGTIGVTTSFGLLAGAINHSEKITEIYNHILEKSGYSEHVEQCKEDLINDFKNDIIDYVTFRNSMETIESNEYKDMYVRQNTSYEEYAELNNQRSIAIFESALVIPATIGGSCTVGISLHDYMKSSKEKIDEQSLEQ